MPARSENAVTGETLSEAERCSFIDRQAAVPKPVMRGVCLPVCDRRVWRRVLAGVRAEPGEKLALSEDERVAGAREEYRTRLADARPERGRIDSRPCWWSRERYPIDLTLPKSTERSTRIAAATVNLGRLCWNMRGIVDERQKRWHRIARVTI